MTEFAYMNRFQLSLMSGASDNKVSHEYLYVLCLSHNPCFHVSTLEGDKQRWNRSNYERLSSL